MADKGGDKAGLSLERNDWGYSDGTVRSLHIAATNIASYQAVTEPCGMPVARLRKITEIIKIAGVTIKKQRAGAADPRVMGKTDSLGTVTFASSAVWRQSNNMFTFTIDGMLKNGYVYEPDAASKSRHFTVKPHWLLNILSHLDAPLAAGRT